MSGYPMTVKRYDCACRRFQTGGGWRGGRDRPGPCPFRGGSRRVPWPVHRPQGGVLHDVAQDINRRARARGRDVNVIHRAVEARVAFM